ncbi:YcxB family protein [Aestuariibacter halophilus]|uniref:YcxB family protein n=1 Tax=Fluctibacter halophilus TaxID=226011 RepID=A0ABS8G6U7_9ALTE|nr:YcxB family protein [Aestuariibacter halophilus]MCC2616243.1 YcxB family protein [Aestuariibacter halophilus]
MTSPFHYTTTYTLDKSHFSETYDQSVDTTQRGRRYLKSLIFVVIGVGLYYPPELSGYLGTFFVALGIVDALSVRFDKSWWLFRQMISKAANHDLTLTLDEQGVRTQSLQVDSQLLWTDIDRIQATEKGWLLHHGRGKYYLSNRCLSADGQAFLADKREHLTSN